MNTTLLETQNMITTSSYEQDFYSENEQYEGQKLNDNGRQQAHTIADTSKACPRHPSRMNIS